MIEMLGVLAIVGVLSVGGIAGYSKAMEKFKINETINQLSQITTNIRILYSNQTAYTGIDTSSAINMGVIPDSIPRQGTGSLINKFGGPLFLRDLGDTYLIGVDGITKEACIELATKDWGTPQSSRLYAITIGYATYGQINFENCQNVDEQWGIIHCAKNGTVNIVDATNACQKGATLEWGNLGFGLMFK